MKTVVVTGVTGFLGSQIAIALLNKGYKVIGTLRDISKETDLKKNLQKHTQFIDNLICKEANLTEKKHWQEITQHVDAILHVASPFPSVLPKTDDEIVTPAKQGTLTILEVAAKNNVKRVIVTSSMAAVIYGKTPATQKQVYTESDWTDETNLTDSTPYYRSKTIAEKAAWDYVSKNAPQLELVTICPSAILGPLIKPETSASTNLVIKLLDRSTPFLPKIGFEVVDVRSVVDMHIKALENEQAAGNRFLCSSGYVLFKDISKILKEQYPNRKIPTKQAPNFLIRIAALFDKTIKPILVDLGKVRTVDNSKAKKILGWEPISPKEAIISCAQSVIDFNIVK